MTASNKPSDGQALQSPVKRIHQEKQRHDLRLEDGATRRDGLFLMPAPMLFALAPFLPPLAFARSSPTSRRNRQPVAVFRLVHIIETSAPFFSQKAPAQAPQPLSCFSRLNIPIFSIWFQIVFRTQLFAVFEKVFRPAIFQK